MPKTQPLDPDDFTRVQFELIERLLHRVEQRLDRGDLSLDENLRLLRVVSRAAMSTADLIGARPDLDPTREDLLFRQLIQVVQALAKEGLPPHVLPKEE